MDPLQGVFARPGAIALNAVLAADSRIGENVAMFNSYAPLLEKVKNLKRAQVEAELRCF